MSERVFGFVGLGNMGGPMARRLLEAGNALVVYDRNEAAVSALTEAGAEAAASVKELGDKADVVFLSLPTPDVVKLVCLGEGGLCEAAKADVIVDLSTTGPQVAAQVAEGLKPSGKAWVDCPVSGGVAGAVKGALALMVSGPSNVVGDLSPAFDVFGKHFVVGDKPGLGQSMKVINNLMSSAALTIASEAMVLGVKSGLDPDLMIEVLNAGSGRNSATTDKIPKFVLPRGFDFGFAIALSSKDARLCLEEGDRLGVPMIVGTAVRQLLNIARDELGPDADMTEVIRVVEGWAGVEVKGKAAG